MAMRNHTRSLSQPERAFWREVYGIALAALIAKYDGRSHALMARDAADHADLAVAKLRERITWRQS